MTRTFFLLMTFALAPLFCWSTTYGQDQPQASARTSPDYTRFKGAFAKGELPLERPTVLWKFFSETVMRSDGTSHAVPVTQPEFADGHVYFGDDKGRLFALNADDGTELWCHEHGSRIYLRPRADRDHVYFGSDRGAGAVRRDTGKQAWFRPVEQGANDPLPIGERVFVSGNCGWSYALDQATGKVLWKHDFLSDAPRDRDGHSAEMLKSLRIVARPSGSASDGKLFMQCVFDQSRVIALDVATGERRWTFEARNWVSSTPTIADGRVYFSSQDASYYCLNAQTGRQIWQFKTPSWFSSQGALHDGDVFVPYHKGRLYQLNAATGELVKSFEQAQGLDIPGDEVASRLLKYHLADDATVIAGDIANNRRRIFLQANPDIKDMGEASIIAIGEKE